MAGHRRRKAKAGRKGGGHAKRVRRDKRDSRATGGTVRRRLSPAGKARSIVKRIQEVLAQEGKHFSRKDIADAIRKSGRTPERMYDEIQEQGAIRRALAKERGLTEAQAVKEMEAKISGRSVAEQADHHERAAAVHAASDAELGIEKSSFLTNWHLSRLAKIRAAIAEHKPTLQVVDDSDWPTQAEAASRIGLTRQRVGQLIRKGEMKTNGKSGRACRVNPASLQSWLPGGARRKREAQDDETEMDDISET